MPSPLYSVPITARHNDKSCWMFGHQFVDLLAALGSGLLSHGTRIDNNEVGRVSVPGIGLLEANLLQTIRQRRGLGKVQAAPKSIIGDLLHRQSERIR